MNAQQTLSGRAWAELILLSLLWGGSFMAFRVALDEVGVFTIVLHRVGWAAILLWGYATLRGYALPRDPKIWGAFLIMGLLNNVIPFGLIAWGQLTVESGLASIFNASTALFAVPVAAAIFADEKLTLSKIVGAVLGFLGVAYAIGFANLFQFDPRSVAQLAILAASLSYALASSWGRKMLTGLPPAVAAAGMLTGSTVLAFPLAIAFEGPLTLSLMPSTWGAIIYVSIFATMIAYLLYYRVLAMAGASNLMLVTLIIPPVAIVVGAKMRAEVLPPQAFVGLGFKHQVQRLI